MARVNVEQKALTDSRFGRLGLLLVNADYPEITMDTAQCLGLGRMLRVWNECQERGSYTLSDDDLVVLLAHRDGPSILISCALGEREKKGSVRIRGTEGRVEWMQDLKIRASNGGKSTARSLTPEERHKRATKAASTRWAKHDAKRNAEQSAKHYANALSLSLSLKEKEQSTSYSGADAPSKSMEEHPEEHPKARILTPQQQAVKDIEDAYRSYDETPPKPGILAKWIKDHTHDGVLAKIHELGPAGQLANGPAYVFAALKGGNRHVKPSAPTPAAGWHQFVPQVFVYDPNEYVPELDDTKLPV